MKTALQVLNRAYGKIQVKSAYSDLDEHLINDGIAELNEMMWELEASGLAVGWRDVIDRDQVLSTPDWMDGMIINGLAIRLAPDIGYAIDDRVMIAYDNGMEVARKLLNTVPRIQFPSNLPTGGARNRWHADKYFYNKNANGIIGQGGFLADDAGNSLKFDIENSAETND